MINQRLFEHYNIDTKKNLQIKNICPRPYDTILIDKTDLVMLVNAHRGYHKA